MPEDDGRYEDRFAIALIIAGIFALGVMAGVGVATVGLESNVLTALRTDDALMACRELVAGR